MKTIRRLKRRQSLLVGGLLAGVLVSWGGPSAADLCPADPFAEMLTQRQPDSSRQPIDIEADSLDSNARVSTLLGNVLAIQGDLRVKADRADYYFKTRELQLMDNIRLFSPYLVATGQHAKINTLNRTGWLKDARYHIPRENARGHADRVEVDYQNQRGRLYNVDYTTCPEGQKLWRIKAEKIVLDRKIQRGTARDMTFWVGSVPVAYLPYLSFPTDKKRHSGLLAPGLEISSRRGVVFSLPYYWNIAPNRDMTITPGFSTKRGLIMTTENRFLWKTANMQLGFQAVPYDYNKNNFRGGTNLKGQWQFHRNFYLDTQVQLVTDHDYTDDFKDLNFTDDDALENHVTLFYSGLNWDARLNSEGFQTLDKEVYNSQTSPYAQLPQLQINVRHQWGPVQFKLGSEGTYFYHKKDNDEIVKDSYDAENHIGLAGRVRGARLDLWPQIEALWQIPGASFRPRLSYRYTAYALQNTDGVYKWFTPNDNPQDNKKRDRPFTKKTPDRGLPMISLDGRLRFERPTSLFYRHKGMLTLEPRLFYLYIPYRNQDDIPIFDSARIDQNFSWLFQENRFTGADRVGDANQLTTAMVSRFLQKDGAEQWRFSIGQISYFEDRRVQLPGDGKDMSANSGIISEMVWKPWLHWRGRGTLQTNDSWDGISRALAGISYSDGDRLRLNAGFRYAAKNYVTSDSVALMELDLGGLWQVNENWLVFGHWNQALKTKLNDGSRAGKLQNLFAGVGYESCCVAVRGLLRWYRDDPTSNLKTSFKFEVVLKGLSDFGDNIDDFLKKTIPKF